MGRLDPFRAEPERIDAALSAARATEEDPRRAIRRALVGIGPTAAELVFLESRARGCSVGRVLSERLEAVLAGRANPVVGLERMRSHLELAHAWIVG